MSSKYIQCGRAGVYFLIQDNEIVYIGSTTDFPRRITAHHDKKFNRIRFIECSDFRIYEKRLMRYFKPKYNVQIFTQEWRRYLIDSGKLETSNCRFLNY